MSATPYHLISAASTNATSVTGAAASLSGLFVTNANAAVRYLKLFDKATAPTLGTDTPVYTVPIPAANANNPRIEFARGLKFDNGIAIALTTGIADNDTGAVGANDHAVNLDYQPGG